jgi:hypothetical protein
VLENKRKFERFDLAVITQFKPVNEVTQHSLGLTKNFSREGLSIETRDFNFTPDKNLNLEIKSPNGSTAVSLIGDVMWKRQGENTNIAGVKLIFKDEKNQKEALEKLSSYGNIPVENVLGGGETFHDIKVKKSGEASKPVLSAGQKDIPSDKTPETGFLKEYIEDNECKVTFRLPEEAVKGAENVTVVGDFNDWDTTATPMERLEGGGFQIILKLSPGREYKFRYLVDGDRWENDWHADKYVPNSYGGDDSVVIV